MKLRWIIALPPTVLALLLSGCTAQPARPAAGNLNHLTEQLRSLRQKFAPDAHLAIYDVDFTQHGDRLILSGEMDSEAAHRETVRVAEQTGFKIADEIRMLPDAALGGTNWGITTISVANGREKDEHKAELGTQTVMGEVVKVLKNRGRWLFVQSNDGYLSWMEASSLQRCTRAEADAWEKANLLQVTAFEALIIAAPSDTAVEIISDIVSPGRVKWIGEESDWFKVELPDLRTGFLAKTAATSVAKAREGCDASPDCIERTAKTFLGRPYLWGANTPRGMDCSGLTKLTFFLNGIKLQRNASQQARQGVNVPIDRDLSQLKKGDLLFFGFERPGDQPSRVSHTAIYLGNKLFIQSSGRVRLSSLDPNSPIADQARIRGLIAARRIQPAK